MKRYQVLTLILLITSVCTYGQNKDEVAIRNVMKELAAANLKSDVSVLDRVYASDFIFISPIGKKYTKTERLAYFKEIPPFESFTFKNEHIRLYGNAAVVNTEVELKAKGQDTQHHYVTLVMIKKGNQWVEVNGQATPKSQD